MLIGTYRRSLSGLCLLVLLIRHGHAFSALIQKSCQANDAQLSRHSHHSRTSRTLEPISAHDTSSFSISDGGKHAIETINKSLDVKGKCDQASHIIPAGGKHDVEAIDESLNMKRKCDQRLLWACILLAVAQISSGSESFSGLFAPSKNVSCATVSASLLRRSRARREVPTKLILAFAFLGIQFIGQARTVVSLSAAAFTKCSKWYIGFLASHPLYTKACTSAVIGLVGDAAAQYLEEKKRIRNEGNADGARKYDQRRGLSIVADGLFISGPLMHIVYDCMEAIVPVTGGILPPSVAALAQVLMDNIFVDALFVAITYISTGIIEGHGMKTLLHFKEDFARTVKTGWATSFLLMPLTFMCFRFLPISFRVLGINLVDVIWDGVLSFEVHKNRIRKGKEDTEARASNKELALAVQ
eukprot:scaffold14497_cov119-Cylindrotheca_fusiformis.AAC.1